MPRNGESMLEAAFEPNDFFSTIVRCVAYLCTFIGFQMVHCLDVKDLDYLHIYSEDFSYVSFCSESIKLLFLEFFNRITF